jgi:hypothetical protein
MVTGQILDQLVINALSLDIVHRQVPIDPEDFTDLMRELWCQGTASVYEVPEI